MKSILAIDAAWTRQQPSGIAIVGTKNNRWTASAVAPSYATFIALAKGKRVDWNADKFKGCDPDATMLMRAAKQILGGTEPDVIVIDMPIASVRIVGRRVADSCVSRRFGAAKCSAHSPSVRRPGPLGEFLTKSVSAKGYDVATCCTPVGTLKKLVEVYPHPALLTLMGVVERVPYKVSKCLTYWPGTTVQDRINKLLKQFDRILEKLKEQIDIFDFVLPASTEVSTLAQLKRYEDALDALVSAWVGIKYLKGDAVCLGDHTAAIWIPRD